MRVLAMPLLLLALLPACEPLSGPAFASAEEKPCQSDADCEMHTIDSPRQPFCRSVGSSPTGSSSAVDAAACGPMPTMTTNAAEPVLACFRGTCVSVGSKR